MSWVRLCNYYPNNDVITTKSGDLDDTPKWDEKMIRQSESSTDDIIAESKKAVTVLNELVRKLELYTKRVEIELRNTSLERGTNGAPKSNA
jgi:hypothetical protein